MQGITSKIWPCNSSGVTVQELAWASSNVRFLLPLVLWRAFSFFLFFLYWPLYVSVNSKGASPFFSTEPFKVVFQVCDFCFSYSSFVYVWQLWVAFKFLLCFTHLGWFALVITLRRSGQWRQHAPKQSCVSNRTACTAFMFLALSVSTATVFPLHIFPMTHKLTHTFHKVSVLYFIPCEANKQKWIDLSSQTLSHPCVDFFSHSHGQSHKRFIQRRSSEKMASQFKSLWPVFILGIDSGTQ